MTNNNSEQILKQYSGHKNGGQSNLYPNARQIPTLDKSHHNNLTPINQQSDYGDSYQLNRNSNS